MVEIECDNCKQTFMTYKCYLERKNKRRFCSKKCEAEYKTYNNTLDSWKGGHISKSNGYKYIEYRRKAS